MWNVIISAIKMLLAEGLEFVYVMRTTCILARAQHLSKNVHQVFIESIVQNENQAEIKYVKNSLSLVIELAERGSVTAF